MAQEGSFHLEHGAALGRRNALGQLERADVAAGERYPHLMALINR
jgi:hypothetical protein